eukprot:2469850-Amphidinium_carterae.1
MAKQVCRRTIGMMDSFHCIMEVVLPGRVSDGRWALRQIDQSDGKGRHTTKESRSMKTTS